MPLAPVHPVQSVLRFLSLPGFALAMVLALVATPATATSSEDADLIAALRAGGLNLYFRHMATEWSQSDHIRKEGDWRSCDSARVRQLSDVGREQARIVGSAIGQLRIPVGEVLASPYCRTVESARLLQLGEVRETFEVMNLRAATFVGGRARVIATARALLSSTPATGNRVIVAHGNVARESTPVYPGEGEMVIFEPLGDNGFRLLGRVAIDDWPRLLALDTE